MARIELVEGVTLKGARRILSKRGGAFGITKRHGRLYTFKKFKCVQPNTEAQMECREKLRRANELAREDLAREGRREYWKKKAEEMGYKTAVGCARAWYMAKLRGRVLVEKEREVVVKEEVKEAGMVAEARADVGGVGVIRIGRVWKKVGKRRRRVREGEKVRDWSNL
ncbi:MAG: hypothetical protein MJZ15_01955 [Bacteroidales bacterium]|nr:hypothetical protein [Bacteroidales bacterium]